MATASSTPQEKKTTNLPPRRGQIKLQIFENLIKAVVSMASKPGDQAQGKNGGEGGGGGGGGGSASRTPPPSGYNSDANSDI